MLSTTLKAGLADYAIGEKIRALRLKKKMGLVELGQHAGLSPALLSKIERDLLFPTLPTLLKIALVFSVGLEYFFSGPREAPVVAVVRKTDRLRFPEREGAVGAFHFESLDFPATERRFNSYYAEFTASEPTTLRRHQHGGAEFIYVLRGTLVLHVAEDEYRMGQGDSVYFDPHVPHAYQRGGARPCHALVVTTP
ncbi:MAG: cupin domain-containing protein [Vicinamibacterales bacterium]